ncbi:hypothetical protein LXA43DRAFT_1066014 [Ganoderma leucocontextum]|nr:hypothetical protein LXA43DRAFT_1066014 [Ganoderma leucocontextum]
MDPDPILVLIFLLMLYLFCRDLRSRTPLTDPVAQHGVASGEEALQPEEHELRTSRVDHDQEDAKSIAAPVRDGHWTAFKPSHAAMQALEEKRSPGPATGSSTSITGDHGEQSNAIGASASHSNVFSANPNQPVVTSTNPVSPTASVSTTGPSLVKKFAGLKVNTAHPFLASRRSSTPDGTPPSSPLSSLPSSPSFSSSSPWSNAVDFSLYKKKTRVLTKSPKKSQTTAAGKSPSNKPATDVTTTTWFYKISTGSQLLDTPPDLTGHPDGLAFGDIYFDWVEDHYQLWLWCLDSFGVPHWMKIPFGYERKDGKHLIVTCKIHFLSWVTAKYYKELINDESSTSMDVNED